ncbi:MAG TPA: LuxR C-terminal-related transcriptional regulator [Anaerolineales bacterium]|nr:LuxR C-terminal-related transcriptional regulator [Anaerolineales bacterium]
MSINSSADPGQAFSKLGVQEKKVLLLLSEGQPDSEIAKVLFLGEGTIRNFVNSILVKLGLNDRVEATNYAWKHNLRGHLGYSDQV